METYTEAKNSTEKHFFTTNEDKRETLASLERKLKTKNLEKNETKHRQEVLFTKGNR